MIETKKIETFLNSLEKTVKVVSFDVYDTLLMRFTPTDRVFWLSSRILSKELKKNISADISPDEIYLHRKRYKKKYDRRYFFREAEWNLTMWLKSLSKEISVDQNLLLTFGKLSEIEAEFRCTELYEQALEIVGIAKERGFYVIATSDMWIETDEMVRLLKLFDLEFYAVFTSGSLGVSKRRGTIFRCIQEKMAMSKKCFAHIGDNFKADWLRPCLAGWSALLVNHSMIVKKPVFPTVHGIIEKKKSPDKEIIQILQRPQVARGLSVYYRVANYYIAPLLILFCVWQWRHFSKQEVDIVFYIARDARAMFDVYQLISSQLPGSPPCNYIRLSRKIVAIGHPDELLLNVKPLPGKLGKKRIVHWMSNFPLGPELQKKVLDSAGLDENEKFNNTNKKKLKLSIVRHQKEIKYCIDEQKQLIRDYIVQQAGGRSINKIGLVDSGWACTIQDSLRNILEEVELITGVYFGVSSEGCQPDYKNKKIGLLRDDFRNLSHFNALESSAGVIRLWDTILRETVGTATHLERDNEGKVIPVTANVSAMERLEREAGAFIKEGVIDGAKARMKSVKLLVSLLDQFSDSDIEKAAAEISKRITIHPKREIASAFLRLGFDEGVECGSKAYLGFAGIKKRVAWYPGILSFYGFPFLSKFLEPVAKIILLKKMAYRIRSKSAKI